MIDKLGNTPSEKGNEVLPARIRSLNSSISNGLTVIGLAVFSIMLLAVCLQMIVRWIATPYFGINISWAGALAQMALVWITLIGGALASRDNEHIKISFFKDRLPSQLQKGAQILISLATLVFLAMFAAGSFVQLSATSGRQFHTLPTIPPLTRGWFYIIATGACGLMIIYTMRDSIEEIREVTE